MDETEKRIKMLEELYYPLMVISESSDRELNELIDGLEQNHTYDELIVSLKKYTRDGEGWKRAVLKAKIVLCHFALEQMLDRLIIKGIEFGLSKSFETSYMAKIKIQNDVLELLCELGSFSGKLKYAKSKLALKDNKELSKILVDFNGYRNNVLHHKKLPNDLSDKPFQFVDKKFERGLHLLGSLLRFGRD